MNGARAKASRSVWLIVALLLAVAAVVLYRSAYNASDFWPPPDAVEYALGAHRFVSEGSYAIAIQGQRLPSRYPPWFSILVLAPAYKALGLEPGNAIYPVTLLGAAGVVIAFFLGKQLNDDKGGILAALAVLGLPTYRLWGRVVMTDVPCAVLVLGLCLIYIRLCASTHKRSSLFLLAGVLIAILTLFRPVCSATVLPFSWALLSSPRGRQRLSFAACLMGPLCVAATMTMAYSASTFGSVSRNGYQFWCPVPYDYLRLTFSASYVTTNLGALWASKLPPILGGAILALGINYWLGNLQTAFKPGRRQCTCKIVEFLLLGTGPIVVFHLFYFFPEPRFFLPTLCLSAVLAASIVGGWLPDIPRAALLAFLILTLLLVSVWRHSVSDAPPHRRIAADRIKRNTPDHALIVSAIDPVYLEYMIGSNSQRLVIPISRRVEYADKLIAYKKVQDPVPHPLNWGDHRCQGLINGGAKEAVPYVASENLNNLRNELRKGTRVFVDTTFMAAEDVEPLDKSKLFRFSPCAEFLYELHANDHS